VTISPLPNFCHVHELLPTAMFRRFQCKFAIDQRSKLTNNVGTPVASAIETNGAIG
jgi:hypothetical protein